MTTPVGQPRSESNAAAGNDTEDLTTQLATAQRRALSAERRRREAETKAVRAEQATSDLEAQLARVVAELEILRGEPLASPSARDSESAMPHDGGFALFQDALTSQPTLAADGSDPGVLPIALAGTGLVALMVAVIAGFNGRLLEPFGIGMVAITAALIYFAWQTRVERIEVQISRGGVVYVERSSTGSLRFDLGSPSTRVTISGEPGTHSWALTFARGGGRDSFTVTAAMVDSIDFTRRVRAFRPEL